jgi:acetyl-CoA acetyltransferase
MATIEDFVAVGSDPVLMLGGPIPATERLLDRNGLAISDIDLFEINEAFAPVVLGWAKAVGASLDKTNVNGGAIALGHPLGATGAKLVTSLTNELRRREGRYGLVAICEGGGTANAMLLTH